MIRLCLRPIDWLSLRRLRTYLETQPDYTAARDVLQFLLAQRTLRRCFTRYVSNYAEYERLFTDTSDGRNFEKNVMFEDQLTAAGFTVKKIRLGKGRKHIFKAVCLGDMVLALLLSKGAIWRYVEAYLGKSVADLAPPKIMPDDALLFLDANGKPTRLLIMEAKYRKERGGSSMMLITSCDYCREVYQGLAKKIGVPLECHYVLGGDWQDILAKLPRIKDYCEGKGYKINYENSTLLFKQRILPRLRRK